MIAGPRQCPRCGTVSEPDALWCCRCGAGRDTRLLLRAPGADGALGVGLGLSPLLVFALLLERGVDVGALMALSAVALLTVDALFFTRLRPFDVLRRTLAITATVLHLAAAALMAPALPWGPGLAVALVLSALAMMRIATQITGGKA